MMLKTVVGILLLAGMVKAPEANSDVYHLENDEGEIYTVFCEFYDCHIYTYISRSPELSSLNISSLFNKKDHIIIRHLLNDSSQLEVTYGQIERYSHLDISVQFNTSTGYQGPLNIQMVPYVFVGLLPVAGIIHKGDTQGYSANGVDYTFTNCDGNPNNYFVLLFNAGDNNVTGYNVDRPYMRRWLKFSTTVPAGREFPPNFFFSLFEMHMGGCGGYITSDMVEGLVGATIGLRYDFCPQGCPLSDEFCGEGGIQCPAHHYCNTSPIETFAVCCRGCTYNRNVYAIGASFPSTDGCNTCVCMEDFTINCTTKCCFTCPLPSPQDFIKAPIDVIPERRRIIGECYADINRCPAGSCIFTHEFMPRTTIKVDVPCPVYGAIKPITTNDTVDCGPAIGPRDIVVVTSCVCERAGIIINVDVVNAANNTLIQGSSVELNNVNLNETEVGGRFTTTVPSHTEKLIIIAYVVNSDFIFSIKVVDIPVGFRGPLDVTVALQKRADPISIDRSTNYMFSLSDNPLDPEAGVATLAFDPTGITRPDGQPYLGPVELSINFINVSNLYDDTQIPGQFLTSDSGIISPLISDGIFMLTFLTPGGGPLKINRVLIGLRDEMTLWSINPEGMWDPIPDVGGGMRRKKRQLPLNQFLVDVGIVQWVNIDRIPGAPQCYFKARVFQTDGATEITTSTTTTFVNEVLGFITSVTPNQRLRMYTPSTRDPADTCFSVRCPEVVNGTTLTGFINMTSYESVIVGGVNIPVIQSLTPKTLGQYPDFQDALAAILYQKAPNNVDIYVNFISNVTGPFYTDIFACEASMITQPAFHFIKPPIPNYEPVPSDTALCTARLGIQFAQYNISTFASLSLPNVTAVSVWSVNGTNFFYTDNALIDFSTLMDTSNYLSVCVSYRCSQDSSLTTVYLTIISPSIPDPDSNTTSSNDTIPVMFCSGTCAENLCINGAGFNGSFVAPAEEAFGPDFYTGYNNCELETNQSTFAASLFCNDKQQEGDDRPT